MKLIPTFTVVSGVNPSLELLSSSSIVLETTFEHSGCLCESFETSEVLLSQPGLINGKYGVGKALAAALTAAADECKRAAEPSLKY